MAIHADESDWQSLGQELGLNLDSLADDFLNSLFGGLVHQMSEHQACEVGVETFVSGDELVAKRQTWHKTSLLEPEDGSETSGEENPFNGSVGDDAFSIGCLVGGDPVQGPFGLLLHSGDGLDGVEESFLLSRVPDVRIDEKTVHLAVDVLDGDLEAVETTSFRDLHFLHEPFHEIFVDDSVRCGEESQDVGDEVLLFWFQVLPVDEIL